MEQTNKAVGFAMRSFEGMTRKDGKTPYFFHLQKTSEIFISLSKNSISFLDDYVAACYLHDYLEMCKGATVDNLSKEGFNQKVINYVIALTRPKDMVYADYLECIIKKNDIGLLLIKIADKIANLSDSPSLEHIRLYADTLTKLFNEVLKIRVSQRSS